MNYDPYIASASPRELIRIVDRNPDASQLEKRLAEALEAALDGDYDD